MTLLGAHWGEQRTDELRRELAAVVFHEEAERVGLLYYLCAEARGCGYEGAELGGAGLGGGGVRIRLR